VRKKVKKSPIFDWGRGKGKNCWGRFGALRFVPLSKGGWEK